MGEMKKGNAKVKQYKPRNGTVLYECNSCNNTWSLDEGFRLDTGQCAGCQKWDDDRPKRLKEQKEREEFLKKVGNCDFPYVPGDPFW